MACGDSGPLTVRPYDASGELTITPDDGSKGIDPDEPVRIRAEHGRRITDVVVSDSTGRAVPGRFGPDGRTWLSGAALGAGARYTVRVSVANGDGTPGRGVTTFTTAPKGRPLRVVLGPSGRIYGVGQPVTARLSHPVHQRVARAVVESGLRVTSSPAVPGRWYWVDARTLHYRPRHYWPPGTTVTVASALAGARVREGLYGGPDHTLTFRTGARVEALVDAAAHRMTVRRNGMKLREIPVTTGKPGFSTRNGIKVVLRRDRQVRMTGTSIGIAEGSSESYDLQVHWATRLTLSGEYVHAAPWSAGSHGLANVSHGCVGMSMKNAEWFYRRIRLGDIVRVVGSEGSTMPAFGNGFGDWNVPWERWRKGSALSGSRVRARPPGAGHLTPYAG